MTSIQIYSTRQQFEEYVEAMLQAEAVLKLFREDSGASHLRTLRSSFQRALRDEENA